MAKAASKSSSKALVPWEQKFAGYAQKAREQVKTIGGGVGISFGRGNINVGGLPVKDGKLECVIIGSCALNAWYEADYDKDDKQPPECYAFALVSGDPDMSPHEKAEKPQHDDCATCPKNQFGTAKRGNGKACANRIRLAIITAKEAEDADDIPAAQLAVGSISPTNLKRWAAYVKLLSEEYGRSPEFVVTEISSYDDPDIQIRVEFRMIEKIDDPKILTAIEKRMEKVQEALQQPYGPRIERAKNSAKAGASKKFAGGGKVGRR